MRGGATMLIAIGTLRHGAKKTDPGLKVNRQYVVGEPHVL
jgi:hypothetical protein